MTIEFSGDIWFWKGPAPFHFVKVPPEQSRELKDIMRTVTYGWGMIPVVARIGETEWKTSLWPKDGLYLLPVKDRVRTAENLEEGDRVTAWLEVIDGRL